MIQYPYNLRVTFPETLASYTGSENHTFSISLSLILEIVNTLASVRAELLFGFFLVRIPIMYYKIILIFHVRN